MQDGHQAHSRAEEAYQAGSISGVIWSPGDHPPAALDALVRSSWLENATHAIDPQLYVAPLADASPKKLLEYGLFDVPMRSRDFAPRSLLSRVERILGYQADTPVTHGISPTVSVESMVGRWAQVAANLADTSMSLWSDVGQGRPLLVSVAVTESLLADAENVDALLDELTSYECDGFYLLMENDPNADPAEAAVRFERALYIVYTLAELNDYVVWIGYAGLSGFIYRAAGAEVFGAGWWQKQNWWSTTHWTPAGGGRQPRPRIYLESLIGSLLIDVELRPIARQRTDTALLQDLLRGSGDLAADFRGGRPLDPEPDRGEMTHQLLAVCAALDDRITGVVTDDMRRVLDDVAAAELLQRRIRDVGVQLDPRGGRAMLTVWQTAVMSLGDRLGLTF